MITRRRVVVTLCIVLVVGLLAFLVLSILVAEGYSRGSIRIDCGDVRYTILGIPYDTTQIQPADRDLLLSVAAWEPRIPPKWYPVTTWSPDQDERRGWQLEYQRAAAWAAADPRITRLILEDMAAAISRGKPPDSGLWALLDHDSNTGRWTPVEGWYENLDVLDWLAEHGYTVEHTADGRWRVRPTKSPVRSGDKQ